MSPGVVITIHFSFFMIIKLKRDARTCRYDRWFPGQHVWLLIWRNDILLRCKTSSVFLGHCLWPFSKIQFKLTTHWVANRCKNFFDKILLEPNCFRVVYETCACSLPSCCCLRFPPSFLLVWQSTGYPPRYLMPIDLDTRKKVKLLSKQHANLTAGALR